MFEYLPMTGSVRPLHPGRADDLGQAAANDLESVQPWLPTVSALAELLPGSGLRRGASYSIEGSTALALATLVGASEAGSWCGVVGVPSLGTEAAAGLGVDLDRLALVPFPGTSWLEVVAALIEAVDIVVVRPPTRVFDADARRLAARVRQRGAVLVVLGQWPGCELRLTVTGSQWTGLGAGHGHLLARQVTVSTIGRGSAGRPRVARLWLPDPDGNIRTVEATPTVVAKPAGDLDRLDALASRAG